MVINKQKLFFIGHSVYLKNLKVFDPNYAITFGFLNHILKSDYFVIRHSLYKGGETRLYTSGVEGAYKKIPFVGVFPDTIRYIFESMVNLIILLAYRPNVVLAIDPLSCFIPVFLKKVGLVKRVFFITPDYADTRFNNPVVNSIYFCLDKYCTLNSDRNICCSDFVIETKTKKYKVKNALNVFFHMPNIPNPWLVKMYQDSPKAKNSLVYVGNISRQLNFEELFNVVIELTEKYPDISLKVLGSGDLEEELKITLQKNSIKNIKFMGQLSHTRTLEEIATSSVGVAVYNGTFNYDKYRDSCKIREYQALGTIPLSTRVVISNRREIERFNSGVLVDSVSEIKNELIKIFDDSAYTKILSENSLKNSLHYISKYAEYEKLISE